ncbi:MAG: hypothetical protein IAF38_06600 [Bacteroidia bacterium]|nr:hypothetical protein [Bacteroidia bacterium]
MSDGQMLESGGMIYISAKSGDEELILKTGTKMEIKFASGKKLSDMQIFSGVEQKDQINWLSEEAMKKAMARKRITKGDFREEYKGYDEKSIEKLVYIDDMILSTGSLGWINCDRFSEATNKTEFAVEMDTSLKPVIRLVFKDINSVMSAKHLKGNKFIVSNVPAGKKATLIAFSLINDEPFFASKEIIIGMEDKENLEMLKTTLTLLQEDIRKLN